MCWKTQNGGWFHYDGYKEVLVSPVFFVQYSSILGSILEYFGHNTEVFSAQILAHLHTVMFSLCEKKSGKA
jgi:hypothetical protein